MNDSVSEEERELLDAGVPLRIGPYRIVRRLSAGTTSDVYLTESVDPRGGRKKVVLKTMLAEYRRAPTFHAALEAECDAYRRLVHPAIVPMQGVLATDEHIALVVEWVDGLPLHTLRALLRRRKKHLDDRAAFYIASRVFSALAAAHATRDPRGDGKDMLLHRDVNPSNVLVPWDGFAKLVDFGFASTPEKRVVNHAGFLEGTLGYMAPEQARGEKLTPASDVYSASLVLWELLARRKAFARGHQSEADIVRAMAAPRIASLDVLRPDVPSDVRRALRRGLYPLLSNRTLTADEMATVLRGTVDLDQGRELLVRAMAEVRPRSEDEAQDVALWQLPQALQESWHLEESRPSLPSSEGDGPTEVAPKTEPMPTAPPREPRPRIADAAPPSSGLPESSSRAPTQIRRIVRVTSASPAGSPFPASPSTPTALRRPRP
ncbi:MAG: protein kinase [Polyangiaceae bacterium]